MGGGVVSAVVVVVVVVMVGFRPLCVESFLPLCHFYSVLRICFVFIYGTYIPHSGISGQRHSSNWLLKLVLSLVFFWGGADRVLFFCIVLFLLLYVGSSERRCCFKSFTVVLFSFCYTYER